MTISIDTHKKEQKQYNEGNVSRVRRPCDAPLPIDLQITHGGEVLVTPPTLKIFFKKSPFYPLLGVFVAPLYHKTYSNALFHTLFFSTDDMGLTFCHAMGLFRLSIFLGGVTYLSQCNFIYWIFTSLCQ